MMTNRLRARQQSRQLFPVVGLLFLLNLILPLAATSGEILLSAVGNGQWQISATGLANVHALDLDLRYDAQRLSGLTASAGAGLTGVMTAINDKTPGTIRLGVASTKALTQNGILLNLQSSTTGAEMMVSQFTVKVVDSEGKVVPTTIRQQLTALSSPPQIPTGNQAENTTTSSTAAPPSTRHGSTVSGNVALAADNSASAATTGEEELTPPSPPTTATGQNEAEAAVTTPATVIPASSGAEKHFHSQEEIVTTIERLPKPWTVTAIKAIFLKPAASQVQQKPAVVIADGKSKVRLYLPKSFSKEKPSLGAQGCDLGNIMDAREQGWEVELVTRKGIWPAKVLLLGDGDLIQFPIVIVPALAITPPESDNAAIPSVDLDGDGSISALDAYLYVGNLLAQQGL